MEEDNNDECLVLSNVWFNLHSFYAAFGSGEQQEWVQGRAVSRMTAAGETILETGRLAKM